MVLFRVFTQKKANALGLVGFVRNESADRAELDESVFVVAEGEEEKLIEFITYLKSGPLLAKVKNAEVVWFPATGEFSEFRIEY